MTEFFDATAPPGHGNVPGPVLVLGNLNYWRWGKIRGHRGTSHIAGANFNYRLEDRARLSCVF